MIHLPLLLSGDKLLPGMVALLDNFQRIALVHKFLVESKHIWWLSIRDLVCAEPFTDSLESSWELLLYIVDVIEERGPLVLGIDCDDLPVCLSLIDHTENSKNLHRSDVPRCNNFKPNVAYIQWIVVSSAPLGIRVDEGRILPCAWQASIVEENISLLEFTEDSLLLILLDGISNLISCNLILLPRKLGDLAYKIKVRCWLVGGRVNMDQCNIMPKRNLLLSSNLVNAPHTVSKTLPLMKQLKIAVGSVR
mmetsp:Transcript_8454/g.12472  ORF Transcript_8454/g.12472 Transcript_8454/m.12472 type:complete len:250 (-) Transcript_8454:114-863(-)